MTRCSFHGCDVRAYFGVQGGKVQFCKMHKQTEMINLKSKRCLHPGCETIPVFGVQGGKPKYCASRKQEGLNKTECDSILRTLKTTLENIILNGNSKEINVIHMFYDGFLFKRYTIYKDVLRR